MIFTKTEIDVLKLSAWCKDIPVKQTNIFPAETIETLLSFKLIRPSKCGLSYRCTVFGYELLNKIGFHYSQDKYYRGKGSALTRRINNASITGFFWRYGADVFRTDPCCDSKQSVFLPSFVLRKKVSSNILGGSRLSGFLYTPEFTFIPYYIMPECAGLYADSEQRTFLSESLLCGRKAAVLYTGTGELPGYHQNDLFSSIQIKKDNYRFLLSCYGKIYLSCRYLSSHCRRIESTPHYGSLRIPFKTNALYLRKSLSSAASQAVRRTE